MSELQISSPAFDHGGAIPARFTCDGQDISPKLVFGAVPAGTRSLALIVDDPDAPVGTWVHWMVWNIPPQTRESGENSVPAGAVQGLNDWKRYRYGGPCPPSGTHCYFFKLYALDTTLTLPPAPPRPLSRRPWRGIFLPGESCRGTIGGADKKCRITEVLT